MGMYSKVLFSKKLNTTNIRLNGSLGHYDSSVDKLCKSTYMKLKKNYQGYENQIQSDVAIL